MTGQGQILVFFRNGLGFLAIIFPGKSHYKYSEKLFSKAALSYSSSPRRYSTLFEIKERVIQLAMANAAPFDSLGIQDAQIHILS